MRIDRATRHIAAAPNRIYRALTDRETVQRWLPPEGARGEIDVFEPWRGGAFRMVLMFDAQDGKAVGKTTPVTDVVNGTFVEQVPDRLIRLNFTFEADDPAFAGVMAMRWTLLPNGDGTEVSIVAENVPQGIGQREHETALLSSLENLARCVEQF